MTREYQKFKESELLTGGLACLFIDLGCLVIDFTGVGIAVSVVAKSAARGLTDWWIWSKGGELPSIGKLSLKYAGNSIPFATVVMFFTSTLSHNHPKLAAAAGKVGGSLGKVATKVA
jgi:hypothetical protein